MPPESSCGWDRLRAMIAAHLCREGRPTEEAVPLEDISELIEDEGVVGLSALLLYRMCKKRDWL
jgi:hypothetical protein